MEVKCSGRTGQRTNRRSGDYDIMAYLLCYITAIIHLLLLFRDSAHSPTIVKHGIDIIREVTHHVNPGQIPVLTVDQPLYAIAKRHQWKWPDEYG